MYLYMCIYIHTHPYLKLCLALWHAVTYSPAWLPLSLSLRPLRASFRPNLAPTNREHIRWINSELTGVLFNHKQEVLSLLFHDLNCCYVLWNYVMLCGLTLRATVFDRPVYLKTKLVYFYLYIWQEYLIIFSLIISHSKD